MDKALAGLQAIGFTTTAQNVHAPFDSTVASKPGVQWYPDRLESANPTINILGSAAKSQDGTAPVPTSIEWNFDDGTTPTTAVGERFDHTFPGPGSYEVTATVSSNGLTRSFTDTIVIDPPLTATATVSKRTGQGASLLGGALGGSGKIVAAHWTCQDGAKVSGLKVLCKSPKSGTATVTVVDGAGNTAETTVAVAKAPNPSLKIVKAKVKPGKLRVGKKVALTLTVRNTSTSTATGARACVKVPGKAKKMLKAIPACKSLGSIGAGKSKTVTIKLSNASPIRSTVKSKIEVTAKGAKKKTGTITAKPGGAVSASYA